jgi:hypothetical protein
MFPVCSYASLLRQKIKPILLPCMEFFLITLVFYDFKKVITLSPNLLQVSFCLLEYCSHPLIFTEPLVGIFTVFDMQLCLFRFGLWVADLSITQIFQETVEESQRGVLGNSHK